MPFSICVKLEDGDSAGAEVSESRSEGVETVEGVEISLRPERPKMN